MKHETFTHPEYKEGLDADAVCGQCGTVNPEGTLICKTCGNNLRDQRMLRMTADVMLDADEESEKSSVFLFRALPILGILLMLWLGLNVDRISNVLTSADSVTAGEDAIHAVPDVFWAGSNKEIYDALHANLATRFPSTSDAENARLNAIPLEMVTDGKYVLFERLGTELRYVGAAVVQTENDVCRYAAALTDGVEIRGMASVLTQMLTSQWDQAGALYQGEYYALTGTALTQPDGGISLNGESSNTLRSYSAVAYWYSGL